ncbi:MAG: PQQ-dependent sugar dehydrogenase [Luteolibacter sp.]
MLRSLSIALGLQALAMAATAAPLQLPLTLPSTSGYQLEEALPGMEFDQPLAIATAPGDATRLFIVEKTGRIQMISGWPDKPVKSVFLDLPAVLMQKKKGTLGTEGEWGLLGLAFHPRFAENGRFFITYDLKVKEGDKTLGFNCLSGFTISKGDPTKADPDSEVPMLCQVDPAAYHNGGDIHFGPDGCLYYSMGDGGGHYDAYDNARYIDKDFFAAVYRLDVDQRPGSLDPNSHSQASTTYPSAVQPGGYRIPADNPFIKATTHNGKTLDPAKIRTEVYACGFRNPWRFSFDSATGGLFLGVVGEDRWEQIYLVKSGTNGGWSYYEGSHEGPRLKDLPEGLQFTKPIYEYPHGNDTLFSGNSVTGGVVYHGKKLPELEGAYFYGDYISHCVWALRESGGKWKPELIARGGAVSAFGTDPADGGVLLADIDRGRIQKLARAPQQQTPPPATLSATGAFQDIATLKPAPGVQSYEVNHPAWNGGLVPSYWFALPGTEKIGYNAMDSWSFPTGTVFIQQLSEPDRADKPGRRVETRFLMRTPTAAYGITYKWREDQSDADLVPDGGLPAGPADYGRPTPGRAECLMCHTAIAGYTLGMNTWQLNGPPATGTSSAPTRIQALIDGGQLDPKGYDPTKAPSFPSLYDKSRSLEDRCRAYLAVNCSHCHQQDGVASSPWTTKASFPTSRTRLLGGGLNTDFGDKTNKVIAPGDPAHSMILKRLKADGVPRMPMGTTGRFDDAGIELLTEWIRSTAPEKK